MGIAVVEPDPCRIDFIGRGHTSSEWTTAQAEEKCITVSHKLGTFYWEGQKATVVDKKKS